MDHLQKTRRKFFGSLLTLGMALAVAAAGARAWAEDEYGAVTGTVTIAGKMDPRVADTVVWIEGIPRKLIPDERWKPGSKPRMAQKNLRFDPRVLPVLAGTTVAFPNDDSTFHNVFSASPVHKFNLGIYPKGGSASTTFDKPGIVEVNCNVHPRMRGFVVVAPEPYFAAVNRRGLYKLTDVPLGAYTLKEWNPDFGLTIQQFTLEREGQVLDIDFDLGGGR